MQRYIHVHNVRDRSKVEVSVDRWNKPDYPAYELEVWVCTRDVHVFGHYWYHIHVLLRVVYEKNKRLLV